ncbi:MAG: hypothetical protein QRY72_03210 [Candidatus Rhabdochlamydia sp.]
MSTISPFNALHSSPSHSSPPTSPQPLTSPEEKGLENLFLKVRQAKQAPLHESHSSFSSTLAPLISTPVAKGKRLFEDDLSPSLHTPLPPSEFVKKNKPLFTPLTFSQENSNMIFEPPLSACEKPSPSSKKPLPQFFEKNLLSPSRKPPETPRKQISIPSLFTQIRNTAQQGFLVTQGKKIPLKFLADGSYMSVYELDTPTQLLLPAFPTRVVVKLYHGKNTPLSSSYLKHTLNSTLTSYTQLLTYQFPVAQIYNADTARQDGFILQEKISYPLQITLHLEQILDFFARALKHHVIVDLLPSNFKVKEDGEVVLIDFVEDPSDGLEIFLEHALHQLCQEYLKETNFDPKQALALLTLIPLKLPELMKLISTDRWKTTLESVIVDQGVPKDS